MDAIQEAEWRKAQEICISAELDLVSAAKNQLMFLASIDRKRRLYEGPTLQRAICRYEQCWLPLLAKHTESSATKFSLVPPLDCEWVWHCHRLNPVQYAKDCEKIYGRMLDATLVDSFMKDSARKQTEEIWANSYPREPYDLDMSHSLSEDSSGIAFEMVRKIEYDLAAAVQRQSPFFNQVSRPHMSDDCFLRGAEERYKGFLYLIKKNKENSVKCFCVPTYDIDLMWHSHQLQPVSYKKDMLDLLGQVLEHDDMDSDRSEGKKLDVGFTEITKQWENTFGRRYWRAGAMYKGEAPSPVPIAPPLSKNSDCMDKTLFQYDQNQHDQYLLPERKTVEVLLEAVKVRNVPVNNRGALFVRYCKQNEWNDNCLAMDTKELQISSEAQQKQVATFQCEATGDLVFELRSQFSFALGKIKHCKLLGRVSISLQTLLDSPTLSVENWFALSRNEQSNDLKPMYLHLAISVTPPVIAPYLLYSVRSCPSERKCQFLQSIWRIRQAKRVSRVLDAASNEIFTVETRTTADPYVGSVPELEGGSWPQGSRDKRRIVTVFQNEYNPGETAAKAEELISVGDTARWSLLESSSHLMLKNLNNIEHGPVFELLGNTGQPMRLLSGRKLHYEIKGAKPEVEREFVTLVRYTPEAPFGRATSLFNWKSGIMEVCGQESILLVVLLSTVISASLAKHRGSKFLRGYASTISLYGNKKKMRHGASRRRGGCGGGCGGCGGGCGGRGAAVVPLGVSAAAAAKNAGGCGGCGGGCGGAAAVRNWGGCGGGCGGSGGCGGAAAARNRGGCGGGCGGSGGCGGGGGGGCGGNRP